MKKILSICLTLTLPLTLFTGCGAAVSSAEEAASQSGSTAAELPEAPQDGSVAIVLSDEQITVDGEPVSSDESAAVYTANDIVFYPTGQDFTFGEGETADAHEPSEADAHTVIHITRPGTYRLSGKLSAGQVAVDLGEEAQEDPAATVTLILDGVDITCTVAPGVIFYNVYECGSSDAETASKDVDTSKAGANVIIADGSVNTINGAYVARIYKPGTVELSEDGTEVADAKKLHKYDAAFYSKMSMNISGGEKGDGVLNIHAKNEGLDSELHLTVNGGKINIVSGNDGINTNEDGVSVTTVNGGSLNILCDGSTGEGDGIDSNGWLVINGGTVISAACATSGDAGIDSDMGIHLNGGTVVASGNMMDRIGESDSTYAVFSFSQRQTGGSEFILKNESGEEVTRWTPANDFTYLVVSGEKVVPGTFSLWQGETRLSVAVGMGGMMGGRGPMPENFDPENMAPPEGMEPPEGFDFKELPENFDPENMTPPEGFDPETMTPPEGFDPAQMQGRPGGFGGGKGFFTAGEASDSFSIAEGANQFTVL